MKITIINKNGEEEKIEIEDSPLKERERIFKVGNKWYIKKIEYIPLKPNINGFLRPVKLLKDE